MAAKRSGGSDIVDRLSDAIGELISENRKLRRELLKLSERGASAAAKTIKRGARSISRGVKKAVSRPTPRRPRKTATRPTARRKPAAAAARRKPAATQAKRKTPARKRRT
ncbi:MAG: hypothetical protein E6J53_01850 [Chloroflexi bacterium]|nr:MAG: hypothetical protein E6J53_01850 [Chloroflexota bacterium]